MKAIVEFLKTKIRDCDELGGMEKEKWAFQKCLQRILLVEIVNDFPGDLDGLTFKEQVLNLLYELQDTPVEDRYDVVLNFYNKLPNQEEK